jgi:hypothetical protein
VDWSDKVPLVELEELPPVELGEFWAEALSVSTAAQAAMVLMIIFFLIFCLSLVF